MDKFWSDRKDQTQKYKRFKKGEITEPFNDKLEGRTIEKKDDPIDWTL